MTVFPSAPPSSRQEDSSASTISATTPDHLWRAQRKRHSACDRRESRLFVGGLTNAGARLTTGGQRAPPSYVRVLLVGGESPGQRTPLVFFLPNT
jgi:hypothetical protein